MDEWTVVQRRRRGPRTRPNYGSWGNGGRDWMARAPTFPSRGRTNFKPNPPMPPPYASRFSDSHTHSYANVVRGTRPRVSKKKAPQQEEGSEVRRAPAEPRFGRLVRKMHMVIKMLHHLQKVSCEQGKSEPRMISRMVHILSAMINPAAPTTRTNDLIIGNAKNWGYTTCLILEEHYQVGIETLLEEMSSLLNQNWKEAFQVAVRWAKRNLRRLPQDVIDHAEALIAAKAEDPSAHKVLTEIKVHSPIRATKRIEPGDEIEPCPLESSEETGLAREPPPITNMMTGGTVNTESTIHRPIRATRRVTVNIKRTRECGNMKSTPRRTPPAIRRKNRDSNEIERADSPIRMESYRAKHATYSASSVHQTPSPPEDRWGLSQLSITKSP